MRLFKGIAICLFLFGSAVTLNAQYTGTCCQRSTGYCTHQNGMVFEDATWIQGASSCTGHEEFPE